jgi:hypothetical protein
MRLPKLVKTLMASGLLLLTLSGCQSTRSVETNELTFCAGARPIYWSRKDTLETVGQVKEHNTVGVRACGWKGNSK